MAALNTQIHMADGHKTLEFFRQGLGDKDGGIRHFEKATVAK
jgi:hypothetical protein